ncbi:MAG: hypothetical protein ABI601_07375 [bacterium]
MTEPSQHSDAGAARQIPGKRSYDTPALKVYGDLARLTRSLKNSKGADGHPGNGMSKTG